MKKILSILLVAILALSVLVSCGGNGGEGGEVTAESLTEAAEAALESATKYQIVMTVSMFSENEQFSQMLATMGGSGTTVTVTYDGDNLATLIQMGERSMSTVLVGNTLYSNEGESKIKVNFSDDQRDIVLAEGNNVVLPENDLSFADFETVNLTETDGKYVVACSGLKEGSLDKLGELAGSIAGNAEGISITGVELEFAVKDGKYEYINVDMICEYAKELTGFTEDVSCTITMGTAYDFDIDSIAAPADADTYTEISFDDYYGIMSYYEFMSEYTEVGTYVIVDTYVQAKQSWWFDSKAGYGKGTIYTQNEEGGFFIYEAPLTEEEYNALTVGTKIRVYGYKAEWSGEVEIIDCKIVVSENTDDTFVAEAEDISYYFTEAEDINEALLYCQNNKIALNGFTVASTYKYKWNNSGVEGDDLYLDLTYGDATLTVVVESYLCDKDSDVYKAVKELKVGDVVNLEGFLYWYDGPQPHITSVTVVTEEK